MHADLRAALERCEARVYLAERQHANSTDDQWPLSQQITDLRAVSAALRRHLDAEAKPVGHVRGYVSSQPQVRFYAIEFTGESLPYGTPLYTADPLRAGVTEAVAAEMRETAKEFRVEDRSAGIFPDHETADLMDAWAARLSGEQP